MAKISKDSLQILIDHEDDGVGRQEADEIRFQPAIEASKPFLSPNVVGDFEEVHFLSRTVVMHDGPDHDERVGQGGSANWLSFIDTFGCDGRQQDMVAVELQVHPVDLFLDVLVDHEVDDGVRDAQQRGRKPLVEGAQPFLSGYTVTSLTICLMLLMMLSDG